MAQYLRPAGELASTIVGPPHLRTAAHLPNPMRLRVWPLRDDQSDVGERALVTARRLCARRDTPSPRIERARAPWTSRAQRAVLTSPRRRRRRLAFSISTIAKAAMAAATASRPWGMVSARLSNSARVNGA